MRKFFCLAFGIFLATFVYSEISPERVYILANSNDKESVALAYSYAKSRKIPEQNIISLPLSQNGIISRATYLNTLESPLIKKLTQLKAIDAFYLEGKDKLGRDICSLSLLNVDFLVLCKGVPWGISITSQTKPMSAQSDYASVDSELSARFLKSNSFAGFLKNPLYDNFTSPEIFRSYGILRVARLDGSSYKVAENLFKDAISTETLGLRGRAYIDKSLKTKGGDAWLDVCYDLISKLGYEVDVDSQARLYPFEKRMDGIAFYFGWYANKPATHFNLKDFKASSGAVGVHIYSYGARNLNSENEWCSRLASVGISNFGNVFEPFLGPIHQPHKVMEGISKGMALGEAAYASIPVLSWQGVFIGDPLYKPLKLDLDSQIRLIEQGIYDDYSQYAIIRKMNILIKSEKRDDAILLARSYLDKIPDFALLWKLSKLAKEQNDKQFELHFAKKLFDKQPWKSDSYLGLSLELADLFSNSKDKKLAEYSMRIYSDCVGRIKDFDLRYTLLQKATKTSKTYKIDFDSSLNSAKADVDKIIAERKAAAEKRKAELEAKKTKAKTNK